MSWLKDETSKGDKDGFEVGDEGKWPGQSVVLRYILRDGQGSKSCQ